MKNNSALFVTGMFGIIFGGLTSLLWSGVAWGRFVSAIFYVLGAVILFVWLMQSGDNKQKNRVSVTHRSSAPISTSPISSKKIATKTTAKARSYKKVSKRK